VNAGWLGIGARAVGDGAAVVGGAEPNDGSPAEAGDVGDAPNAGAFGGALDGIAESGTGLKAVGLAGGWLGSGSGVDAAGPESGEARYEPDGSGSGLIGPVSVGGPPCGGMGGIVGVRFDDAGSQTPRPAGASGVGGLPPGTAPEVTVRSPSPALKS